MSDSRAKKNRARKAKKDELKARSVMAYRRRAGLGNNEEEAELASYFRRFVAFSIDQIVYVFFFFFYSILLVLLLGPDTAIPISGITSVLMFGLLYFTPLVKKTGQTYGARKAKIVVIHKSGENFLNAKQSGLRWFISLGLPALISTLVIAIGSEQLGLLLSALAYVVVIVIVHFPIFRTSERQGLHDMFASSVVIKELKPIAKSK